MTSQRTRFHVQADQFETALRDHGSSHPDTDDLVQVTRLLHPAMPIREDARRAAKARMLRAAQPVTRQPSPHAGSLDAGGATVHAISVPFPGGRVLIADVEPIDPDAAAVIARRAVAEAATIVARPR